MQFTTAPPKPDDEFRQAFAFFPTRVGIRDDGRTVWLWLRRFAWRYSSIGEERRPLEDVKGVRSVHINYE